MSRKLDNFSVQVWELFERVARGEELKIPFSAAERSDAISTCHALRAFRRCLIDDKPKDWPRLSPVMRERAHALFEPIQSITTLGPQPDGDGWCLRVMQSSKKPIAGFLGRAVVDMQQEPASPGLDKEIAESLERMKRRLGEGEG